MIQLTHLAFHIQKAVLQLLKPALEDWILGLLDIEQESHILIHPVHRLYMEPQPQFNRLLCED